MKKYLVSTFIAIICTGTVVSDTYLVQKSHTDAYSVAGTQVPAQDEQSVTWSSGDKIRVNNDKDTSMLMRLDKKMTYTIFNKAKKYVEVNFDEIKQQVDMAKGEMDNAAASSGMPEMSAALVSMMQFSATVKPTSETKKIGKWNSQKYIITMIMPMGTTQMEMWTSTDIKINYADLAKMKNLAMSGMPGFASVVKEYEKVKGFPVLTEITTKVMGMEIKSREELIEATDKAAPAGIYDIPAGYKKTSLDE